MRFFLFFLITLVSISMSSCASVTRLQDQTDCYNAASTNTSCFSDCNEYDDGGRPNWCYQTYCQQNSANYGTWCSQVENNQFVNFISKANEVEYNIDDWYRASLGLSFIGHEFSNDSSYIDKYGSINNGFLSAEIDSNFSYLLSSTDSNGDAINGQGVSIGIVGYDVGRQISVQQTELSGTYNQIYDTFNAISDENLDSYNCTGSGCVLQEVDISSDIHNNNISTYNNNIQEQFEGIKGLSFTTDSGKRDLTDYIDMNTFILTQLGENNYSYNFNGLAATPYASIIIGNTKNGTSIETYSAAEGGSLTNDAQSKIEATNNGDFSFQKILGSSSGVKLNSYNAFTGFHAVRSDGDYASIYGQTNHYDLSISAIIKGISDSENVNSILTLITPNYGVRSINDESTAFRSGYKVNYQGESIDALNAYTDIFLNGTSDNVNNRNYGGLFHYYLIEDEDHLSISNSIESYLSRIDSDGYYTNNVVLSTGMSDFEDTGDSNLYYNNQNYYYNNTFEELEYHASAPSDGNLIQINSENFFNPTYADIDDTLLNGVVQYDDVDSLFSSISDANFNVFRNTKETYKGSFQGNIYQQINNFTINSTSSEYRNSYLNNLIFTNALEGGNIVNGAYKAGALKNNTVFVAIDDTNRVIQFNNEKTLFENPLYEFNFYDFNRDNAFSNEETYNYAFNNEVSLKYNVSYVNELNNQNEYIINSDGTGDPDVTVSTKTINFFKDTNGDGYQNSSEATEKTVKIYGEYSGDVDNLHRVPDASNSSILKYYLNPDDNHPIFIVDINQNLNGYSYALSSGDSTGYESLSDNMYINRSGQEYLLQKNLIGEEDNFIDLYSYSGVYFEDANTNTGDSQYVADANDTIIAYSDFANPDNYDNTNPYTISNVNFYRPYFDSPYGIALNKNSVGYLNTQYTDPGQLAASKLSSGLALLKQTFPFAKANTISDAIFISAKPKYGSNYNHIETETIGGQTNQSTATETLDTYRIERYDVFGSSASHFLTGSAFNDLTTLNTLNKVDYFGYVANLDVEQYTVNSGHETYTINYNNATGVTTATDSNGNSVAVSRDTSGTDQTYTLGTLTITDPTIGSAVADLIINDNPTAVSENIDISSLYKEDAVIFDSTYNIFYDNPNIDSNYLNTFEYVKAGYANDDYISTSAFNSKMPGEAYTSTHFEITHMHCMVNGVGCNAQSYQYLIEENELRTSSVQLDDDTTIDGNQVILDGVTYENGVSLSSTSGNIITYTEVTKNHVTLNQDDRFYIDVTNVITTTRDTKGTATTSDDVITTVKSTSYKSDMYTDLNSSLYQFNENSSSVLQFKILDPEINNGIIPYKYDYTGSLENPNYDQSDSYIDVVYGCRSGANCDYSDYQIYGNYAIDNTNTNYGSGVDVSSLEELFKYAPEKFVRLTSNIYGQGILDLQAASENLNYQYTSLPTEYRISGEEPTSQIAIQNYIEQYTSNIVNNMILSSTLQNATSSFSSEFGNFGSSSGLHSSLSDYSYATSAGLQNVNIMNSMSYDTSGNFAMSSMLGLGMMSLPDYNTGKIVDNGRTKAFISITTMNNDSAFSNKDGKLKNLNLSAQLNSDKDTNRFGLSNAMNLSFAGGIGRMNVDHAINDKFSLSFASIADQNRFGLTHTQDKRGEFMNNGSNAIYSTRQGLYSNPYYRMLGFLGDIYSVSSKDISSDLYYRVSYMNADTMLLNSGMAQSSMFLGNNNFTGNNLFEGEVMKKNQDSDFISLGFGQLNENQSFLGSSYSSFFSLSGGQTSYYDIKFAKKIFSDISFMGNYNYGIFTPNDTSISLLSNISDIHMQKIAFGLHKENLLGGTFGLSYIMPNIIRSGSANLFMVTSYDPVTAETGYTNNVYDISPSTYERDVEVIYGKSLKDNYNFHVSYMYRINPYNQATLPNDSVLMMKIDKLF